MNSLSRIFSKNDFESRSEWFDFHLRRILYLPWSIRFNFHYLPFRQAIRLPFMCFMRPTFAKLQGRVVLDCPAIRRGMVQFGRHIAPFPPKSFRWENQGTVVFKGRCILCDHSYISCGKDAYLEFGDRFSAGSGCRIACQHKIIFEACQRISWDCTFVDSDFHPLIDIVSNAPIKMKSPIHVGYGVWIGYNSIVCKGVKLPAYTTVSSGSVVKTSFKKEKTIIGGNPAQLIDEGYQRDDC